MILVDAGPLVALCDDRDALHARAVDEVDRVHDRDFLLLTAVLGEACFLLGTRALRARLQALVTRLDMQGFAEEASAGFRDPVFEWLDRYGDQQPDFADACLAVLSARERSAKVWTFDSEFVTTWRRPDGSRIPVALASPARRRSRRR